MSSLFVITGKNAFLVWEERRRWIDEFIGKHGAENCIVLREVPSVRTVLDEVAVQPFLAEKRLVVCDAVPKCTAEEMEYLAENIHPQTILLFATATIDKRTAGAKALLSLAKVKDYPEFSRQEFGVWMKKRCEREQLQLEESALQSLRRMIGDDPAMMATEIEKLSQFAMGRTLDSATVEQAVLPTDEGVIWRISDHLIAGEHRQALSYAKFLLGRGTDAHSLWAVLLSFLKNLVTLCAAYDAGITGQKELAAAADVHPYVVRVQMPLIRAASREHLHDLLCWAAAADCDLKTGALRSSDDAPQEAIALIEIFVCTFNVSFNRL